MGRLHGANLEEAVAEAVSIFGAEVRPKLRGPGEPEDQLRGPTDSLVRRVSAALGLNTVLHGEVRLVDLRARPDYGVDVAGAPVGFIEIKRPGKGADPDSFTGHDVTQWEKLKLLPNVLYTDGNEWATYRNGVRIGEIARFNDRVRNAGGKLAPRDGEFIRTLKDFLLWKPQPPRTIGQLVQAVANLCRLLRSEVRTALVLEARGQRTSLFTSLAKEWRHLLFPEASDEAFADQYAQTVTFALLLARMDGIDFDRRNVQGIAKQLGKKHLLMGRALAVLTDDSLGGLGASLDTLVHVIGAVDWDKLDDGSGEACLRLYQDFLAVYDAELRQRTGSYHTPNDIVSFMVRSTEDILRSKLRLQYGFASPEVVVVDPAMGTGTFLLHVLKEVERTVAEDEGYEAVGPRLREMAARRLIGFEKQVGPYAVAEFRLYDALRSSHSDIPDQGLRLYVADTLDSPFVEQTELGIAYRDIAASRESANKVKREERVMVVVANPPHDKVGKGAGKWVETGKGGPGATIPIDEFRTPGNGRYESVLTSLHVYFWRWATWKVFDYHNDAPAGVVAFVTPSAYLRGRGFAGMREYLRRTADEGWLVDLSPEGHQPGKPTRLFPEVQQPLCIGIFARYGPPDETRPANIHYAAAHGRREEKLAYLRSLTLKDPAWIQCPHDWQAPFLPQHNTGWATIPLLDDLMPWSSRGVTPGKTWVYAPNEDTLIERWWRLVSSDADERRELFHEARDRDLHSIVDPLPGITGHGGTLAEASGEPLKPIRVGFRAFDRQWLIPDNRLMVVPRPDLWWIRSDRQVYLYELHTQPLINGPGVTVSEYIPDLHYHKGSGGGRALPLYRDAVGSVPNVTPDLLPYLAHRLDMEVTGEDLVAYIAGVVAHPGYTERFHDELQVPGVRVPLTTDQDLWQEGIRLGREVLWLHTYGERFIDQDAGRPQGPPRLPDDDRPKVVAMIPDTESDMPEDISYDPRTSTLHVGKGRVAPVPPEVWTFEVCGRRVVKRWFDYRKRNPSGRRSSALDDINPTRWPPEYTTALLNLLNVLGRLVQLELEQATLLELICEVPVITIRDLEAVDVLPVPARCRKPLRRDESPRLFSK